MKQLFIFLTPLMFLAFGCTTDNSGNTTVVPLAPTNLSATVVSTTQVKLNWTDNATNEAGYKIQRKTGNGNFADVASTGTDITTHDDLGLTANTSYTYRVYAFNNVGNSIQYSNEVTVTTNGSAVSLPSVTIGTQIWSTKNLDVARYRNGEIIPQVRDSATWMNLTTGAWCWYKNDSLNYGTKYGRLYNWYAVNDPRGLAPQGWHVSTDADWNRLIKFLDPNADTSDILNSTQSEIVGALLKSTNGWYGPNTGIANSYGFTALPGGERSSIGFSQESFYGMWWTSTPYINNNNIAPNRQMGWGGSSGNSGKYIVRYFPSKYKGFSVRLVKD